ncbi:MAG: four helix bundle protein [Planctomycetaceae bacterium]|nr:four helix bundle protein [Planctomycetaceae bacterium]
MTYERFEDLPVWRASIKLGVGLFALTSQADFAGHSGLRDQIERAVVSISNNIAEGFERGTTQELLTFLYIARGSAGEVRSMLCLMCELPGFSDFKFKISNLKLLAENVSRQLRAWADSLQNSWIKGQRYLTDQDRQSAHARRRAREFEEHRRKIIEEGRQAMRDPADIEDTESEGER